MSWWNRPSGYGSGGQVPNGVLVVALAWTAFAFPFAATYLLAREARRRIRPGSVA